MKNLSGQTIQAYDLRERIGAGGFGAVYRAFQSTVGREVAIKVILPGYANNPDFIRRFEMEAQLIARLEHLHIVPLYDYWRDSEGAYIVMRWLRGGSLSSALKDQPFDLKPAALLLDQVAAGLAAAHSENIIHRDLKPSNVLLDEEGNAYLADFGIARELGSASGSGDGGIELKTGQIAGSLGYLSPEQLRGQPATAKSDIYSLGVTIYETLSGRHPFPELSSVQQLYKHIDEPLPSLDALQAASSNGVTERINEVIQRATAKDPRQRYPDALALSAAFREAAELSQNGQAADLVESLTLREQEILRLIAEGQSNKEIAQSLFVEVPTVKWHITKVYKKLGVRSRVQAIVRARELDLIVTGEIDGAVAEETSFTSVVLPEPANPYKGLKAFEPADNRDFFGREALIESLLKRLSTPKASTGPGEVDAATGRFLAIVGPSGSGKSSLVKAGLIPGIWSGRVPSSDKWFVVDMIPGPWPLDELEIALTRIAADQASNLRSHLDRDAQGLRRAASLILPNDDSELVVIIDQFEELFTLVDDEDARNHFMDLIREAVTSSRSRVRVIITLRADFYDRPLAYPAFGGLIRNYMETLLPLTAEELERAIVRPAEGAGVAYEDGLAARIIEDVNYRPGALPLLQYALTELFEQRQGRLLTADAYKAIGGAAGALARRAEELYQEQDEDGREAIRQMFLRLVSVGDRPAGAAADVPAPPDTRRRVPRSELLSAADVPERLDEIIDTYADYRLLSLDHQPATRQPTVEVAHEAIMREWDRLQGWLEVSRADLSYHRQLIRATAEWMESGRDDSFLLRGSRLASFENWALDAQILLTEDERAFLDAGVTGREERLAAEQERQQQEARLERTSRRRLKMLVAVLVVALAISSGLTLTAIVFAGRAEEQRRLATARELATAALAGLASNPDRSLLLALEAAKTTDSVDGIVLPEVEEILHLALQADRIRLSIDRDGSLAFSPDGSLLAIGDQAGNLSLWDAKTGDWLKTLNGHLTFINNLIFSPDGHFLASASFDEQIKLWSVNKDSALMNLHGHTGRANSVAFSSDARRLVTTGEDGTIRLWDVSSVTGPASQDGDLVNLSESVLVLEAPGIPTDAVFSSDDRRVAAMVPGHQVIVWDADSGEQVLEISGAGQQVSGLAFSPDGNYLAGGSGALGTTVWNAGSGEQVFSLAGSSPTVGVSFSDDGRSLGTAALDGTASMWDLENGQQLIRIATEATGFNFIAFSADGRQMATGSDDGSTRIWDISPAGSLERFTFAAHDGEVYDAIYSPDGTKIASTGADGLLKVWDSLTNELLLALPGHQDGVNFPSFSPDGSRLAAANRDGGVTVWDPDSGQKLLGLVGDAPAFTTVVFSPDGSRLAAGGAEGYAHIWDVTSGQRLASLQNTADIMRLIFDFSGSRLWSFDWAGRAVAWDATSGEDTWAGPAAHTRQVCNTVLWDAELNPSGQQWAAAGFDGLAYVYEAQGEPEGRPAYNVEYGLRGHSGNVTGIAFDPTGTVLASAGFDGVARLWDMESGEELITLTDQDTALNGVDYSPDGRYLVTAGADGTIRGYIVSVDELLEVARSRLSRGFTRDECQEYLHLPVCPDDLN